MLRDVRSNVTDGLLGFATATGDGLHIKIGVSPSVTEKPITILGSMGASTIKSKLGLPLHLVHQVYNLRLTSHTLSCYH